MVIKAPSQVTTFAVEVKTADALSPPAPYMPTMNANHVCAA